MNIYQRSFAPEKIYLQSKIHKFCSRIFLLLGNNLPQPTSGEEQILAHNLCIHNHKINLILFGHWMKWKKVQFRLTSEWQEGKKKKIDFSALSPSSFMYNILAMCAPRYSRLFRRAGNKHLYFQLRRERKNVS